MKSGKLKYFPFLTLFFCCVINFHPGIINEYIPSMADNVTFVLVGRNHLLITLSEGRVLLSSARGSPAVQYSIMNILIGIPLALTGTVTGIVSVIGYTPDIFIPLAGGALLDGHPGALGYRYLFICINVLCVLGLLAAIIILQKFVKQEDRRRAKRKK
jgi:nitrate/nitrite transporter NarK